MPPDTVLLDQFLAYLGSPLTGRFLPLVDEHPRDSQIPGVGYSFGTLIAAKAAGDLEVLRARGLPSERVVLEGEPVAAVLALTERVADLASG